MEISKHVRHDHAELRSLAQRILKSSEGPDAGSRDANFDLFDTQMRRHLAVFDDVFLAELKGDEDARDSVHDVRSEHKLLRKELKRLDRRDKDSHQWTAEFRNFCDRFERLCSRHEALVDRAERIGDSRKLEETYEDAKLKRMRGYFSWNRVASGGLALAGAAAVAGAAYAANQYFSSGRRRSGKPDDDFELRLETDETLFLISSKKVEGTAVVDRDGARIGTIDSFMVDKYTGRVAYAVMRFGGSFGLGSSLFPLPWALLDYEEEKNGYVLDISKEEMMDAPRFEAQNEPDFDAEYRRLVLLFYRPRGAGLSRSGSSGSGTSIGSDMSGTGGARSPSPQADRQSPASTPASPQPAM